jgi:hypothetical protein
MKHEPKPARRMFWVVIVFSGCAAGVAREGRAAELLVGGATISITPELPVALSGQMHTRIAKQVESAVTATALALESRQGERVIDQAIMVSCDLVAIRPGIIDHDEIRVDRLDELHRAGVVAAVMRRNDDVRLERDRWVPLDHLALRRFVLVWGAVDLAPDRVPGEQDRLPVVDQPHS